MIHFASWVNSDLKERHLIHREHCKSFENHNPNFENYENDNYVCITRSGFAIKRMDKLLSSELMKHTWNALERRVGKLRITPLPNTIPPLDAYDLISFSLIISSSGVPNWIKMTFKQREKECKKALDSLQVLMSFFESIGPDTSLLDMPELNPLQYLYRKITDTMAEYRFAEGIPTEIESMYGDISADLDSLPSYVKLLRETKRTTILERAKSDIVFISNQKELYPRPTTSNPERDYFIYCVAQHFISQTGTPLYTHVANLTQVLFNDDRIDAEVSKFAHRKLKTYLNHK